MVHTIKVTCGPNNVIDTGAELQSRGFVIVGNKPKPRSGGKHLFEVLVMTEDYDRQAIVDVFRSNLPDCEVE